MTLHEPVPVEYAAEHFDRLKDKEILLEGRVAKVCQVKGCWMVLASEHGEVRVTFKDYGFFVPPTLIDKKVWAQGMLYEETMDVAEARHFAKDAGKSQEEIEKIDRPVKEYRFVASAIRERP